MNNIMALADAYAEKCADVREYLGGNAGIDEADPYWVAMKEADAELEAAVTALERDAKRYRWLTVNAYVGIAPYPKPHEVWCLRLPNPSECNSLDAAIDKAMEAK